MMNKTEQNRRQLLKTILALGLTGPGLYNNAHANPLMWLLRTAAQTSTAAVVVDSLTDSSTADQSNSRTRATKARRQAAIALNGLRAGVHLHKRLDGVDPVQIGVEHGAATEQWDISEPRSLYLQIPPLRQTISDHLVVYMRDLSTGESRRIADAPLTISASNDFAYPEIPLRPFRQRGLVEFNAVIPALGDIITIQGTPPVLLQ